MAPRNAAAPHLAPLARALRIPLPPTPAQSQHASAPLSAAAAPGLDLQPLLEPAPPQTTRRQALDAALDAAHAALVVNAITPCSKHQHAHDANAATGAATTRACNSVEAALLLDELD